MLCWAPWDSLLLVGMVEMKMRWVLKQLTRSLNLYSQALGREKEKGREEIPSD